MFELLKYEYLKKIDFAKHQEFNKWWHGFISLFHSISYKINMDLSKVYDKLNLAKNIEEFRWDDNTKPLHDFHEECGKLIELLEKRANYFTKDFLSFLFLNSLNEFKSFFSSVKLLSELLLESEETVLREAFKEKKEYFTDFNSIILRIKSKTVTEKLPQNIGPFIFHHGEKIADYTVHIPQTISELNRLTEILNICTKMHSRQILSGKQYNRIVFLKDGKFKYSFAPHLYLEFLRNFELDHIWSTGRVFLLGLNSSHPSEEEIVFFKKLIVSRTKN